MTRGRDEAAVTGFSQSVREGASDLIHRVRHHPLGAALVGGTISDDAFRRWLCQCYLLARECERFLSILLARAPRGIRRPFVESMMNVYGNTDVLEQMVRQTQCDVQNAKMNFATQSFVNFLLSVGNLHSFGEGIAAVYGASYSGLEFWSHLKRIHPEPIRWQEYADFWSSEGIASWIGAVAKVLDAIPAECPPPVLERKREEFRIAVLYELRFMDMALDDRDW